MLLSKPIDEISLEEMTTIEAVDIPEVKPKEYQVNDLDETFLTKSLEKLKSVTGVHNAKQAQNNDVAISRLSHQHHTLIVTPQSLCWDIVGKTGTE